MQETLDREKLEERLRRLNGEDQEYFRNTVRKLSQEVEKYKNISEKDYLISDIWNRRKLDEELKLILSEADKTNGKAGLILLDIDGFKKYNDTQGHRAGDELLIKLGKCLREKERRFSRYGGEEFAVPVPNADVCLTTVIALRLRKTVEDYFKGKEGVTVSLGVATYEKQEGLLEQKMDVLIKKADQALYHAKHCGKNRVKTYTPRLGPI
jgi:diguanylate cyclase (GGDEF)-like protein